jgi:hypothetical protein
VLAINALPMSPAATPAPTQQPQHLASAGLGLTSVAAKMAAAAMMVVIILRMMLVVLLIFFRFWILEPCEPPSLININHLRKEVVRSGLSRNFVADSHTVCAAGGQGFGAEESIAVKGRRERLNVRRWRADVHDPRI